MSTKLTNVITLSELSRFKTNLDTVLAGKVDVVSGKGLSANDFTNDLKTKLDGIAAGAQVNVIESISVNGTAQTITSKGVDITMPTALTDLTNDGNFVQDASYVHTDNNYTSSEKTKLEGVATGAQVNVIESIKVNGTAQTITSKEVDITMPTKVSDLTNDTGFITESDIPTNVSDFTNDAEYITIASVPVASDASPAMDGTAAAGTGTTWARADHVHPTDTSRAPLASPALTGTPTAPTAAAGTNTTQIATTAFVADAITTAVASVYTVKGSKTDVASLPSSGNKKGDVWHVEEDGSEYFWTGTKWEFMGKVVDVSGFVSESDITVATNSQVDALFTAA